MKVLKQTNIYLKDKRNVKPIDMVQGDTGVQLVFDVLDFEIPSGATATLYAQKPSGKFVYQTKGITINGNTVTVDIENQAITEHGKVPYQISLLNGSDEITTFAGLFLVEKSLKNSGATESKTVVNAFDELISEKVAEFRTRAADVASAVVETIPDDYSEMSAKVNRFANGIKGDLSGAVIRADDVSPIEHLPVVSVHSKNLIPYPYVGTFGEVNGVRFTDNGDGTITAIGTVSATYAVVILQRKIDLKDGVEYHIGTENDPSALLLAYKDETGTTRYIRNSSITWSNKYTFVQLYLQYSNGQAINEVVKPYIVADGTATEYTPYVDPATVTVTRCGKNTCAFLGNSRTDTQNGISVIKKTGSASFVINGKSTAICSVVATTSCTLPAGTYTASVNGLNEMTADTDRCYLWDQESSKVVVNGIMSKNAKTFTLLKATSIRAEFVFAEGTSYTNKIVTIQIEKGDVASAFEEYKADSFTPSSDGTVSGLTSVSPTMTILTDTEGVTVECEYIKDTDKVIKKITDALNITI